MTKSHPKTTTIWWIRRDLRLSANPALQEAVDSSDWVLPLFILDPALLESEYVGERRVAFLIHGLRNLDQDLRDLGSRLIVRSGRPLAIFSELWDEYPIQRIVAQPDYSPYARERDGLVASKFPLEFIGGPAIHSPEKILNGNGQPYVVFTPYARQWRARELEPADAYAPVRINSPAGIRSDPFPHTSFAESTLFPSGEKAATERLRMFSDNQQAPIHDYGNLRDRLDKNRTSALSPYLRFGMVSPRTCLETALSARSAAPSEGQRDGIDRWINELAWRDFYLAILHHYPHVMNANFRPAMDNFPWEDNLDDFRRWQDGLTGYPVIDAAMRQLTGTGWMHNRARMIVASFLTKDLLIHWKWGEKWFMQQLIDGDPASNNGGWQWAAGTGADAAPYFRIFNPVTQSKKNDPAGEYIRRWVPELAEVPQAYIHEPWMMPPELQEKSGCRIDADYPSPMVDHAWARQRALNLYRKAVSGAQ